MTTTKAFLLPFLATGLLFAVTLAEDISTMSIQAYLADTNEIISWADPCVPHEYPELMAGTKLNLVISSNASGWWMGGGIYIAEQFLDRGELFGRDYNEATGNYDGSVTPEAGTHARVRASLTLIFDEIAYGFKLRGAGDAVAGPWFILDFNSFMAGDCYIDFFDIGIDKEDPAFSLYIPLVQTRDYDQDHIVTFQDFAVIAQDWQNNLQTEPNQSNPPIEHDLDNNTFIDALDIQKFTQFWLQRTQGISPEDPDPNSPPPTLSQTE